MCIRLAIPYFKVLMLFCFTVWPMDFLRAQSEQLFPDSVIPMLTEQVTELSEAHVLARRPGEGEPLSHLVSMGVERLDRTPAVSRIQALSSTAGVSMVTAGAGMLRPVIRGLSGLRVASMFNGARIESQAWGASHGIFMPERGVGRVEIVRGPAVLTYGADAYGGVLNFVPLGPLASKGRHSELSITGHSATGGMQASAITRRRSERACHDFSGGFNRFGDYRLPGGEAVANSWLQQFYAQGRFGYVRDWGTWDGAYSSSYNTAGLMGMAETGGYQQSGDHLITTGVHLRSGRWRLHPLVSYQLNHRKEFESADKVAVDLSLRTLRYDLRADREAAGGVEWSVGSQGFLKTNTNDPNEVDLATALIPDATIKGLGVFALAKSTKRAVQGQAVVRIDGREVDWIQVPPVLGEGENGGASSRSFGMISGALGAKWIHNEGHLVGLHFTRGNRVPGLSELFANGRHEEDIRFELGDPNLDVETSHSAELIYEVAGSQASWNGAVYVSNVHGFMHLRPMETTIDGLPVFRHSATQAIFKGIEWTGSWSPERHPHWQANLALSAIDARDEDGLELPLIPPANGRLEIGWERDLLGPFRSVQLMSVLSVSSDAVLIHGSARAEIGEHWSCVLMVINAGNRNYMPELSLLRNLGIPEPGRNVRLQIAWAW